MFEAHPSDSLRSKRIGTPYFLRTQNQPPTADIQEVNPYPDSSPEKLLEWLCKVIDAKLGTHGACHFYYDFEGRFYKQPGDSLSFSAIDLRVDTPHKTPLRRPSWQTRSNESQFCLAFGAANAALQMGDSAWTVLYLSQRPEDLELLIREVVSLKQQGARLLLILQSGATDSADLRNFRQQARESGIYCTAPVLQMHESALASVLDQIAPLQQPVILELDPGRSTNGLIHEALLEKNAEDAALVEPDAHFWEGIYSELCRLGKSDRSVLTIIAGQAELPLIKLVDTLELPFKFQTPRKAIFWAAGAATVGAYPIVILSFEELCRHIGDPSFKASVKQPGVTLLVYSDQAICSGSIIAQETLDGFPLIHHTLGLPVVAVEGGTEFESALQDIIHQRENRSLTARAIWLKPTKAVGFETELAEDQPIYDVDVCLLCIGQEGLESAKVAQTHLQALGVRVRLGRIPIQFPLSLQQIQRQVTKSNALVIVDTCPTSGVASELLKALVEQGDVRPISIATFSSGDAGTGQAMTREVTPEAIFEQCRWLIEPLPRPIDGLNLELGREVLRSEHQFSEGGAGRGLQELWSQLESGFTDSAFNARSAILAVEFTKTIKSWIDAYQKQGNRSPYLWKWCLYGVELTTLPCVNESYRMHLNESKVLAAMINVLVDDIADQRMSPVLLDKVFGLIRSGSADFAELSDSERSYGEFTQSCWQEFWQRIANYPNFAEYAELLKYDLLQLLNTVHYSSLINQDLCLLNRIEHELYSPHGMMITIFGTMDLMCSQTFCHEEIGKLRDALWHAQCMARIGNLVTTWRREIADCDFSSGVFAEAVVEGDLTIEQLENPNPVLIEQIVHQGNYEQHFLQKWLYHRRCLKAMKPYLRSIDLHQVISSQERLLQSELESRGFK